jgi:hypothetical protein
MSKKKQAMALFKEYGTEAMRRIHKIIELEQPVIIDFSDVEDEFSAYGDVYWDWVEGTLDFIRAAAEERKVYIFMDGEIEVSCRVSKYDVDPKTRDWSLEDELFDYCVGSLSQYIDLNKGFGEQQFVDFVESWYALKEDESIDDWDEDDEVWDYIIQTFSEGIPSMKEELDTTISNMDSVIKFIEYNKNRLWDSCDVWVTE